MTQFNGSADELFDLLKKEAELIFYQKNCPVQKWI